MKPLSDAKLNRFRSSEDSRTFIYPCFLFPLRTITITDCTLFPRLLWSFRAGRLRWVVCRALFVRAALSVI
jgi:hypothetical protein